MGESWEERFIERFAALQEAPRPAPCAALSIKMRVRSGCFHREHSPEAYAMIDAALAEQSQCGKALQFEEHESGPEILLWLVVTAGALSLAKSVVELVTAIVHARSEGIRKGDRPNAPLENVVRGVRPSGEYNERSILEIRHTERPSQRQLQRRIDLAIEELFSDPPAMDA